MSQNSGNAYGFSDFLMSIPFVYVLYISYSKIASVPTKKWYIFIISFGILFYFCWKQSKEVKYFTLKTIMEIFSAKDISKLRKAVFFLCIGAGLIVFLFFTTMYLSTWFGYTWFEYFEPSKDLGDSFPSLIIGLLIGLIAGLCVSFFLFYMFFFGTILSGTTIAVTIHNFLNGNGFEVETFLAEIFELNLPDFISYIVVIGQLIFSHFLNKSNLIPN